MRSSEERAEGSPAALTLASLRRAQVCNVNSLLMSLRLWNVFYIYCEHLFVFHLHLTN